MTAANSGIAERLDARATVAPSSIRRGAQPKTPRFWLLFDNPT